MEDFLTALREWWDVWPNADDETATFRLVVETWVQAGRPKHFPHPGGDQFSLGFLRAQLAYEVRTKDGLPRHSIF